MKIHKLDLIILDPSDEDLSLEDVKIALNQNLDDWIIHIVGSKTVDNNKGWYDNNPFNFGAKEANNAFNKLLKN